MMVTQAIRGIARLTALTALALLPLAVAQGQALPPKYSVTKLPTFPLSKNWTEDDMVKAMSSDGSKIVGTAAQYAASGYSAGNKVFYWDGAMHEILVTGTGATPLSVTPTGLVLLGISPPSVWTLATGITLLPSPGGLHAAAVSMNDAGVVAGFAYNPQVPLGVGADGSPLYADICLRWAKGVTGWQYTQLPPLPLAGHNFSRCGGGVNAIDQSGNVIGVSAIASPDPTSNSPLLSDLHAVLWDSSLVPHDLGAILQSDPHSSSPPVDSRTDAFFNTRFVWLRGSRTYYSDANGTTELVGSGAASPSAAAKGVNALGQVTGIANFAGGSHAFYWDTTFPTGVVMDLGVLSATNTTSAVGQSGQFNVIDDSGFIVGSSYDYTTKAFLSTPASRATANKLLDLNTLLTTNALKNAGLTTLTGARIINNAGFIACMGTDSNGAVRAQRVVRLTRVQ
jgi:probable HAF family extracellular repeat protein